MGYEIATIVLGILVAVGAVGWAKLWRRGIKIVREAKLLTKEYRAAVADGKITDREKAQIGERAVEIIESATDIWQAVENLVREISRVVRK